MSYSLHGLMKLCGKQATPATLQAIAIGLILPVLAEHEGQRPKSLSWYVDRLTAGVSSGRLAITFDRFGQLCGYVQWAHVSPDVSSRLLKNGTDALRPEEMLGGAETWIIDLFVLHGELKQILTDIRDRWLFSAPNVTYFRAKRGRRIAKRVSRSDKTSFFRRPSRSSAKTHRFLETKEGDHLRFSASNALDAALELGEIAQFARQIPSIGDLPMPLALARLRIPANQLQRRVYRDEIGDLSGFLTWGWLDVSVFGSAVPAPHHLAPFQWNEGSDLVLLDAFAAPKSLPAIARDLERGLTFGEPLGVRAERHDGSPDPAYRLSPEDIDALCAFAGTCRQPIDAVRQLSATRGTSL